jgi:tetratricopeptide (TPR) repeat protein
MGEAADRGKERRPREGDQTLEEILLTTLPYAASMAELVFPCWSDLITAIVKEVSAETLLCMTRALSGNDRDMLVYMIEKEFLRDMTKNVDAMKADYQGHDTLRLLDFYERAVAFLSTVGSNNTGVLAGNIAIIYRRRKDEEKTLRYRKISMEDYLRQGIPYDALIEKMNLATAYREFHRTEEAAATLREALEEAKRYRIGSMIGSIAGNLAAVLRDIGDPASHGEIMECFGIEESYFRSQSMARDLAISLINQAAYHIMRGDASAAAPKLMEGAAIIRENRFKEFYQAISAMEAMLAGLRRKDGGEESDDPRGKGDTDESEEEARAFFEELLAVNGAFAVVKLYVEEGRWNATCIPAEENAMYHSMLRLVKLPGLDNEVVFGALFSPVRYTEAAAETMKAYVEWSNTLTFYEMTLHSDFEVQGVYRIRAAGREELKDRFHFYLQLWTADCLAMTMLSMGVDLATCQGLKLTVLDMDEDDDDDDGGNGD